MTSNGTCVVSFPVNLKSRMILDQTCIAQYLLFYVKYKRKVKLFSLVSSQRHFSSCFLLDLLWRNSILFAGNPKRSATQAFVLVNFAVLNMIYEIPWWVKEEWSCSKAICINPELIFNPCFCFQLYREEFELSFWD